MGLSLVLKADPPGGVAPSGKVRWMRTFSGRSQLSAPFETLLWEIFTTPLVPWKVRYSTWRIRPGAPPTHTR